MVPIQDIVSNKAVLHITWCQVQCHQTAGQAPLL